MRCRSLWLCLLLLPAGPWSWSLSAAETVTTDAQVATPVAPPWQETFTMRLRDQDRTFAVTGAGTGSADKNGGSWLVLRDDDFTEPAFLIEKDVVLLAKFERGEDDSVRLFGHTDMDIHAANALWATRVESDNVWCFGRISAGADADHLRFDVAAMTVASSDAQLVTARTQLLRAEDWKGRLVVAAWCREQAAVQGNREWWLVTADALIGQVITDAAVQAERKTDLALVQQALEWAITDLRDPRRAAALASAAWVRASTAPAADGIAKRMRTLDYGFYKDQWRPRGEVLELEFDDRFAAIAWKDAEGYYQLGRWADDHADFLPRAKDRIYRCYETGFRADAQHPGIRRELGLDRVSAGGDSAGTPVADWHDSATGVTVRAPTGWKRGEDIGGDVAWVDPGSDTAYLTARVLSPDNPELAVLWAGQLAALVNRPGFTAGDYTAITLAERPAHLLKYTYQEGRFTRAVTLLLILDATSKLALRLEANGDATEQTALAAVLSACAERLVFPAAAAAKPTEKHAANVGKPTSAKSAESPAAPVPATMPITSPATGEAAVAGEGAAP